MSYPVKSVQTRLLESAQQLAQEAEEAASFGPEPIVFCYSCCEEAECLLARIKEIVKSLSECLQTGTNSDNHTMVRQELVSIAHQLADVWNGHKETAEENETSLEEEYSKADMFVEDADEHISGVGKLISSLEAKGLQN